MQNHTESASTSYSTSSQDDAIQVVIVTGYSGAGKNTVLHSLEDIGFFCITNLPSALLQPFFDSVVQGHIPSRRIALGLDVRGDIATIMQKLFCLKSVSPFSLKIVFVTSSYQVLLKRFQETRRRHPLATPSRDVLEAIQQEQYVLQPLMEMADVILDTDQFTIHQLRNCVISSFAPDGQQHMVVTVTTFGFKYGVPAESNVVFDARFLPNPYFVPELKKLNGTDTAIQDYLFAQPAVQEYWERLSSFAMYVIKQSHKEGRFSMNVAIGCTGGRHRSVALAQRFAQQTIKQVTFAVRYRDIERDTYQE